MKWTRVCRSIYQKRILLCVGFLFAVTLTVWSWSEYSVQVSNHFTAGRRIDERNLALQYSVIKSNDWETANNIARHAEKSNKPIILMWTGFYDKSPLEIQELIYGGRKWDRNCCVEVEVTLDRTRLEEASAVVFFHVDMKRDDMPQIRIPSQLWVLFCEESPLYYYTDLTPYNNLFNLTMSFKFDSDIFAPYGYTIKLEKPLNSSQDIMIHNTTLDAWTARKTKFFAAVITHVPTQSRRENVTRIIKHDIDVYGQYGKPVCPRFFIGKLGCDPKNLWKNLASDYKFYFAAENSFCEDYITEKFWRTLEIGMVPVVYGGGNYSAVAPPGSYVDARDFNSPQDLVKFLRHLGKDVSEYRKYFEWRREYEVRWTDGWHGWCDLCKRMKDYRNNFGTSKIYSDLNYWWAARKPRRGNITEHVCSNPFWKL